MPDLYDELTVGAWTLPNRIVMAPLTRNRADENGVHGDLAVEYYAQRADAGLIVTEGTQPSAVGQGYARTPGIHSPEQVQAWRHVADAVHARGGRIVLQMMHAGRIAHPDNKHGLESVAPSALAAPGEIKLTDGSSAAYPAPRELRIEEIPDVVEEYAQAARNAAAAGLDGVEVHGANGYLIHQFLAPGSNQRTDAYGGSPANRARFGIEVTRAVADAIGADRVGIRLSPAHNIQGATEDDPSDVEATYAALVEGIAPLGLAYVSVLAADQDAAVVRRINDLYDGPVIVNTGFAEVTTREDAQQLLDAGRGDAVAVGRMLIANPDLAHRWQTGAELNEPNPKTFYTPGAEGYTDYPSLAS